MPPLTWIHVAGGVTALVTGAVAFAARKGGATHVAIGAWFCVAMFVLGATAAILSPLKSPPESPIGGIMVCYFVATAWMAARRRDGMAGRFEKFACAAILLIALAMFLRGIQLALSPIPPVTPPGPFALFAVGGFCLLAGLGDLRFVLRGTLSRTQRLTRHLWRMGFAFFIATGSFFLGQQQVLPHAVRGSPWLFAIAFAPFALMLFWLVRVRLPASPRPAPVPPHPVEE
jgi:uncharacterized membrane protein